MKVSENSDEIIIRHVPVEQWIIGGFLTFIFVVVCLVLTFSSYSFFDGLLGAFIAIVFVVCIFGLKLFSMISAPLATVSVSQKTKSVDILNRRFYGSQKKRFYFNQIGKFKSYKPKLNFSSEYFLALVLANQKTLKLKIAIGDDKQETVKFIKKLNKFVKAQAAAEKENVKSHSI